MKSNFMSLALEQARLAAARGEVPIGAVLVDAAGQVLAAAGNRTEELNDPSAHAEILAIRMASDVLRSPRLHRRSASATVSRCRN
jgi:tRNA(Arg) A34 adenosine deaminase TadA